LTKDFIPSQVDREKLENAILELNSLLEQNETLEDKYQKWFEKYPFVFGLFEYKRVLSKPRLVKNNGEYYEPDFMVQRIDKTWEIIDLKRTITSILKDKKKRSAFYAEFAEYVSQCHEYSQFFEDSQHREWFEKEFRSSIQRYIQSTYALKR